MLTRKQYQQAFNMAMEEFKNDPHVGFSEGPNPYSPTSDEYRAWNDGWVYARNFYLVKPKQNVAKFQDDRGESLQPSDCSRPRQP
jgi:hypothetical protein